MKAAMSDEQLAEIAARAKAATAGTWHLRPGGAYGADTLLAIVDDNEIVVCTLDFSGSGSGARLADRSFIVQAHRDVPALLARIAELEAERHSTNEALSDAAEAIREKDQRLAAVRDAVAEAFMCPDEDCDGHLSKLEQILGGLDLLRDAEAGGSRG